MALLFRCLNSFSGEVKLFSLNRNVGHLTNNVLTH